MPESRRPFALAAATVVLLSGAMVVGRPDDAAVDVAVGLMWMLSLLAIGVVGRGWRALAAAVGAAVAVTLIGELIPPTERELESDHCSPNCLGGALVTQALLACTLCVAGMAARHAVGHFRSRAGRGSRARGGAYAVLTILVLAVGYLALERVSY